MPQFDLRRPALRAPRPTTTGFLAFLLVFTLIAVGQEKDDPQHRVKIGETAPEFTLKYLDGTTRPLSELRGKVIMLQFTASWCSVCREEMPHIEAEIWGKHKNNRNFVLVGIDFKENEEVIQKFFKTTKISYPLLLDKSGAIFEQYAQKGAGVTRNIIIDKEGKVAFLTRLYDPKEFAAMKAKIDDLLKSSER